MTGALVVLPLAGLYAAGVVRAGPRWPAARPARGVLALLLCAAALGPLDARADRSLAAHMAQHVLLGVLAPALLVAAAPVRLALAALSPRGRRAAAAVLHAAPVRILLRPVVAVALAAVVLGAGHLPGALTAVAAHPLLHATEHAALFWTAVLAWAALLGVDPVPAAPGPVGLVAAVAAWMLPMTAVGAVYAGADRLLVPAAGAGGLAGEHAAGTVMLLAGPAIAAPVALLAAARAAWRQELRQRRREQAEAAA